MLEGDAKVRFEAHLATCPRCQEELVAFGKVRTIAKAALEPVEPTERLTGPLHAQLLHAAAQRKPRGQVVPFMRRVFRHPAYAAAAGLLLIGGAVGVEWSRGKLVPLPVHAAAAPETSTAEAGKTAAPPAPITDEPQGKATTPVAAPAAPSPVVGAESVDKVASPQSVAKPVAKPMRFKSSDLRRDDQLAGILKEGSSPKGGLGAGGFGGGDLSQDGVGTRSTHSMGPVTGTGAATGNTRGATYGQDGQNDNSASSTNSQPSAYDSDADDRSGAKAKKKSYVATPPPPPADKRPLAAKSEAPPAATIPPAHHHAAAMDESEDSAAPPRSPMREQRAKDAEQQVARNEYRAPAGALSKSAATPASPAEQQPLANDAVKQDRAATAEPQTVTPRPSATQVDSIEAERSRAAALVQAGRCDEAVIVYQSIDRHASSRLTSQDRLGYERCLRALGRLAPAKNQIDQMRAHRGKAAMPEPALQAEEKALEIDRKRQVSTQRAAAKGKRAPANANADEAQSGEPAKSNAPAATDR